MKRSLAVRVKQSASVFRIQFPFFMGRSPASFFMHRKVRSMEKDTCRTNDPGEKK